jgi:single-stranded DNA-binding protein
MTTYTNSNAVVFLRGNLGQDPKLSKDGKCVILNLATHETKVSPEGESRIMTVWHTVFVWNEHDRNVCLDSFKKGMRIRVTAKLRYKDMEDAEGNIHKVVVLHSYNGEGGELCIDESRQIAG